MRFRLSDLRKWAKIMSTSWRPCHLSHYHPTIAPAIKLFSARTLSLFKSFLFLSSFFFSLLYFLGFFFCLHEIHGNSWLRTVLWVLEFIRNMEVTSFNASDLLHLNHRKLQLSCWNFSILITPHQMRIFPLKSDLLRLWSPFAAQFSRRWSRQYNLATEKWYLPKGFTS